MKLKEEVTSPNTIPERVLKQVANHKGVDVLDLERSLYDVVDTDALENLFASTLSGASRPSGRVTFPFEGCQVTVVADGTVYVTDALEPHL